MVRHNSRAMLGFISNNLGRVSLVLLVQKSNRMNMEAVTFKLDTGSDFTIIDFDDLIDMGYSKEFLKSCPFHETEATTVATGSNISLQYIEGVTLLFDCIEIKNQRIYFTMRTSVRNLLGQDLLKYFDIEINREFSYVSLKLTKSIVERVELGLETDVCYLAE